MLTADRALDNIQDTEIEDLRDNPYLTRQLIAYIGNKRRLLPWLGAVCRELVPEKGTSRLLDPFCGSGSVARLGKQLGYKVYASDWEAYAATVTFAHLSLSPEDVSGLFRDRGGITKVFADLNDLFQDRSPVTEPYIALHYAPKETEHADPLTERLFYTAENGRFIDKVRNRIEEWYPGVPQEPRLYTEKQLLISSLLYEAATHANTSGVFKAYHKGFGGHGKDALHRIMAPMELELPVLIPGPPGVVARSDAARFVAGKPVELCYLDPPYNQHQYGSNYHLLNTIALWDKPPVSPETKADGSFREKAGIRKDWTATRSRFCYKDTAYTALKELLEQIDAKYLLLSYNTEGIIPFEELYNLLSSRGKTEIKFRDYVTYRGGRQSITRKTHNMEILFVVHTGVAGTGADRGAIEKLVAIRSLQNLLKGAFDPELLSLSMMHIPSKGAALLEGAFFRGFLCTGIPDYPQLEQLTRDELEQMNSALSAAQCESKMREAEVILELLLDDHLDKKERKSLLKRMGITIKKFAFKKYRKDYLQFSQSLRESIQAFPERFPGFEATLDRVDTIASLRMGSRVDTSVQNRMVEKLEP